jgi:tetratricopeptide (TPR) repeat protein
MSKPQNEENTITLAEAAGSEQVPGSTRPPTPAKEQNKTAIPQKSDNNGDAAAGVAELGVSLSQPAEARRNAHRQRRLVRLDNAASLCLTRLNNCQKKLEKHPGSARLQERQRKVVARIATIGRKYIIRDQLEDALEILDEALETAPENLVLHAVRACATLIGGHQEARAILQRNRGQEYQDRSWEAIVFEQLKELQSAPGLSDEMITAVERLLPRPRSLSEYVRVVQVKHLLLAKEFEEALARSELFLQTAPRCVELILMRAHALMMVGRTTEAEEIYEQFRNVKTFLGHDAIYVVFEDFKTMRECGLMHPLMTKIEKKHGH